MIAESRELIRRELEEGTGAAIAVAVDDKGMRSALRIWFGDLDQKHGPVSELRPHGLKSHRVELGFGAFSGAVLDQINRALPEDVQLARALVSSIGSHVQVEIPGQSLAEWVVDGGKFRIVATVRHEGSADDEAAILVTCRDVIVPLMASMAELIGYDVIVEEDHEPSERPEGLISLSVVKRRERNPRNRLLCIRLHGNRCSGCGADPRSIYGSAGSIIEVHHLEPLSRLNAPRVYNPKTDLVPLCPNCHRAVHTSRPVPLTLEQLQAIIGATNG